MVQARRPGRRDSHLSETATSETYRRACRHATDETRMEAERLGGIGFELGGAFAGGRKLPDTSACSGAEIAAPFLGHVAQASDPDLGHTGKPAPTGRSDVREKMG